MKHLILTLACLGCWSAMPAIASAKSADLTSEMDALGANKDLMQKAKAIDPDNRVRVVQNREVDRRLRLEVGLNAAMVEGGDPYMNTNILGGMVDFHISPRWSIGARYSNYSNPASDEGKRVYEDAAKDPTGTFRVPGTDPAKNSWIGTVSWFPIYGKLNLFDEAISQFDLYALAGAGQTILRSGNEPLFTAGGGVGIWLTRHFSIRLEARWQGYTDHPQTGGETVNRGINQTILGATVGFLL